MKLIAGSVIVLGLLVGSNAFAKGYESDAQFLETVSERCNSLADSIRKSFEKEELISTEELDLTRQVNLAIAADAVKVPGFAQFVREHRLEKASEMARSETVQMQKITPDNLSDLRRILAEKRKAVESLVFSKGRRKSVVGGEMQCRLTWKESKFVKWPDSLNFTGETVRRHLGLESYGKVTTTDCLATLTSAIAALQPNNQAKLLRTVLDRRIQKMIANAQVPNDSEIIGAFVRGTVDSCDSPIACNVHASTLAQLKPLVDAERSRINHIGMLSRAADEIRGETQKLKDERSEIESRIDAIGANRNINVDSISCYPPVN